MGFGSHPLDAKLNLQIDDEHRVVVIGTPTGLDQITDDEIPALLRRAAELRAEYVAGYVSRARSPSTRSGGRDPPHESGGRCRRRGGNLQRGYSRRPHTTVQPGTHATESISSGYPAPRLRESPI
jgi:hypothetical protein